MIPGHLRSKIAKRLSDLTNDLTVHEKIGSFVFTFAALKTDRDVEYALEELNKSHDPIYKQGVHIVLEEVAMINRASHASQFPNETSEASAIVHAYLNGFPSPYEPWHHIDNANNDLLREIIKQLVFEYNLLNGTLHDITSLKGAKMTTQDNDQDVPMYNVLQQTLMCLTIWTSTISMQVRDNEVALHIMDGAPRSSENGAPVLIPKSDARVIRDLLNMATARGEL